MITVCLYKRNHHFNLWKLYIETFFTIWSTYLPVLETNACSVLSHWSLSLPIISKTPWSLGRFHLAHTIVTGPPPPTKVMVAPATANTKQLFLQIPPSSDQAKIQHLTKEHRAGSSVEAEQNARKRMTRHTCIFLSPVSYFLFVPGSEVCIRLIILEKSINHWWQSKAKWMKQGLSSRAQKRLWKKKQPGKRENEGMWGPMCFAESASTLSLTSHTLDILVL